MPAPRYVRLEEFEGDPWVLCPHCQGKNLTPARNADMDLETCREDSKAWCPDCSTIYTMGEIADAIHAKREACGKKSDED